MGSQEPDPDSQPDTTTEASLSRRQILQATGAGIGAGALSDVGAATSADRGNDSPPGEHDVYNVGVRPGHEDRGVPAVRQVADDTVRTIDFESLGTVVTAALPPQARDALQNNPNVEYIEPNYTDYTLHEERLPWGIDRINADGLHTVDTIGTENDMTVAVLDTGIDSDHPDLSHSNITGKAWPGSNRLDTTCGAQRDTDCCPGKDKTCLSGHNDNTCHNSWDDDDDHGTHVAGTIAADDDGKGVRGIMPGVDLLAGKVLNGCGGGSASVIADGIRWATEEDADVINMSFGGGGSQTELKACTYAHRKNVILVASAGNSGFCRDCVSAPARYSMVIAVSNSTQRDDLRGDSSTGPEVELAAPGKQILSTIPGGYKYNSGTSMSAPHVAGVAALVKEVTALNDNEEIRARLRESAEPIDLTPDDQGYGLVDALEATDSLLGPSQPDRPQLDPFHATFTIDDEWEVFHYGEISDPVVIAGPATHNGWHPTTVRVKDVDPETGTAWVRLQEWDYLDGSHTDEEVSVAVFEAAHLVELNRAQAETGHIHGVDTNWQTVPLKEWFPEGTTPIVVPQVVTNNGGDAVTPRLRNVTRNSFEIRLQEQESKDRTNEGHVGEQIDYLAVAPHSNADSQAERTSQTINESFQSLPLDHFRHRPDLFAHTQTFNGGDPGTLRVDDWNEFEFDIQYDEEQSYDDETNHPNEESIGYVALEPFDDEPLMYDNGTGEIDQPDDDTWHPVRASAKKHFDDPVVLIGPPTDNGGQPTTVRVRNIGTSAYGAKSFEFQLDEWKYLPNQSHITETLSYGIFEAGTGTIGPTKVEAGYVVDIDTGWRIVDFEDDFFDVPPIVLAQCTSHSGGDPVTVRVESVVESWFMARLQEEEAEGNHYAERIDFLAVEPVVDDDIEAGTVENVDDQPTIVHNIFEEMGRPPDLLASMQTANGGDTATTRFTGWDSDGFGVFIEEEQSADGETQHVDEDVGYVAFDHDPPTPLMRETGTVLGDSDWQEVTTRTLREPVVVMGPPTIEDEDPTTVRVRNHERRSFEWALYDWEYHFRSHGDEDISYAAFEGGVGTIDRAGNARAEAGAVATDHRWEEFQFSLTTGFESKPVVIPQIGSDGGDDAVTVRLRNITTDGFEARLQEQESNGSHTRERIDYIAAEPIETRNLVVGRPEGLVDHNGATIELSGFQSAPDVLAGIQTFNGADPCTLRMKNRNSDGFEVFVDEEQSADDEIRHLRPEEVGYIAFDS